MENNVFKTHKKFGEFETFGEYIIEGRNKKEYSRTVLVEKIVEKGQIITEKQIKLWEKDALYPDITIIYILAELLELSPNDLLLSKQYMYEAGLNAIDMITMRVVCNIIDISIWKIHCFFSVFKWFLLLGCLGIAWNITVPWIMILLFILSIIAGIKEFDGI